MARGRLQHWFWADLRRLMVAQTAADPDLVVDSHGAPVSDGPLRSGYNDTFRAPVRIDDGTYRGRDARVYGDPLFLRCQVDVTSLNQVGALASGWMTENDVTLYFHLRDLERHELIDTTTADPKVWLGTRLDALYDRWRRQVQGWVNPPGMFAIRSQPDSFGEIGFSRNLLAVQFRPREQGKKG